MILWKLLALWEEAKSNETKVILAVDINSRQIKISHGLYEICGRGLKAVQNEST